MIGQGLRVIGIDTGKSGALVCMEQDDGGTAVCIGRSLMPLAGKELDRQALIRLFKGWKPNACYVEKATPMRKKRAQGAVSMFTYGMFYEAVLMLPACLGVSTVVVTPQKWKSKILAGTKRDKDAALNYCKRRFPAVDLRTSKHHAAKDNHNIADAVCIALYGLYCCRGDVEI